MTKILNNLYSKKRKIQYNKRGNVLFVSVFKETQKPTRIPNRGNAEYAEKISEEKGYSM
jgi:hypothetical protein